MYPGAEKAINKELDHQSFLIKYQQRQQQDAADAVYRNKLMPVIYPCTPGCAKGETLFNTMCASCHKMEGVLTGPELKGVVSRWMNAGYYDGISGRDWLKRFIRNWRD